MSDDDIARLRELAERATGAVAAMCKEGRPPRMSIPVDEDRDEDTIIINAITALLDRLERTCRWRYADDIIGWEPGCGDTDACGDEPLGDYCTHCGGKVVRDDF